MAREPKLRVNGPYQHGQRWRVRLVRPGCRPCMESFETLEQAKRFADKARERLPETAMMSKAIGDYEMFLREKGNKPNSIKNTIARLGGWFKCDSPLSECSEQKISTIYKERMAQTAADTHRGELAEVKTFFRWCVVKKLIRKSPAEMVKPKGRRRRGKVQLRFGEAQRFSQKALELAQGGDEGALAAWLGMRSDEVRCRTVRDLDTTREGCLLWIDESKTEAGRRWMDIPSDFAELLKAKTHQRPLDARIFAADGSRGYRSPTWLRKNVTRICTLADVPKVSPHGLQGVHSSLSADAGCTGEVVRRQLGHETIRTTEGHYIAPGIIERARARKA